RIHQSIENPGGIVFTTCQSRKTSQFEKIQSEAAQLRYNSAISKSKEKSNRYCERKKSKMKDSQK
ncbi:hypothetical protein PJP10_31940, partial [Mycobacterium kansasii]